jgi:alkylation response protein AidB-like acyl-CoA dehydrogenase
MDAAVGGAFMLEPVGSRTIFTPEDFSDEQKMFYQTAQDFMKKEVLPLSARIEAKEAGLLQKLMRKAGELGLLMIDVPEKFGGAGLDKVTSMLCASAVSTQGSWATTIGAHTGIGTLPIVYFGTPAQKEKYLPKLASGEWISAYALTEPGSGSDALAAKTKAVLSPDKKHYILNGSKMWITNGAIADVFIVFAKIDGEKFTGFIVEKGAPGFTHGAEEHKMGIRGSSTTSLSFEDVKVPVENVLGEIGKGHKIAFNILNIGRLKLGLAVVGASIYIMEESIRYAKERKQFGKALAEFGLIQEKIANDACLIYSNEAMGYRTAGLIDSQIHNKDKNDPGYDAAVIAALEEFSIESSILKVFGSESASWVFDQGVQIHGGYGYSEEYVVERAHRDGRINRIFEGTNEINRMLVPGTIIKRSMQQRLPLVQAFQKALEVLADPKAKLPAFKGPFAAEKRIIEAAKVAGLAVFNHAFMKYMIELGDQQEILGKLCDIMTDIFAMDSVVTRTEQFKKAPAVCADITRVVIQDAYPRVLTNCRALINCVSDETQADERQSALDKLPVLPYFNTLDARRRIAAHFIGADRYTF